MRWFAGGLAAALVLGWSGTVFAQAAPNEQRSTAYYVGNLGATAGLLGAGLVLRLSEPARPGPDPIWFPGDRSVRANHSLEAARVSDVMLGSAVFSPVVASVAQGVNWRLANRGVVYAETLSINFALNSLAKLLFARPRPYTHMLHDVKGDRDRYVSFYSGHASTSFAAAVTGSYLFAEAAPDRGSRYVLWSTELFLAAATANLRVQAGKHYYSDVIVGALFGVGLSISTLLLHGANYRPDAGEYASAIGGVIAGTAFAHILPFEHEQPGPTASLRALTVSPWSPGPAALGMQAAGNW